MVYLYSRRCIVERRNVPVNQKTSRPLGTWVPYDLVGPGTLKITHHQSSRFGRKFHHMLALYSSYCNGTYILHCD